MNQLLCCLRYYESAGHIRQTAYFMGMHASTACRIVGRVLRTIASLFPSYVKIQLFNCNTGY
ncbi:unnamed protein product [Acanthoscelides obtectus]|uniref:Uncharacterized protein n=1 Tax=Acanthoscelides obtectus TaxID=200917 RepID=A0A9P0LL48_ACAOB|nr:unnamed protein product [Acanthoscelides obtectus]CAK1649824.1 hypothetical protein AOBTE_LOCUS16449 [Acanthoscelides obtectus]